MVRQPARGSGPGPSCRAQARCRQRPARPPLRPSCRMSRRTVRPHSSARAGRTTAHPELPVRAPPPAGHGRRGRSGRGRRGRRHGRCLGSRRATRELAPVPAPPTACPSVGRPAVDAAPGQDAGHGGHQQAGQSDRRQADCQRPADRVTRRPEDGDQAPPSRSPEALGVLGRKSVVARPRRRRKRAGGVTEGDEVPVERRAVGAGGDQRARALALGSVGGSIEEARDEQLVVRVRGRRWEPASRRSDGRRRLEVPRRELPAEPRRAASAAVSRKSRGLAGAGNAPVAAARRNAGRHGGRRTADRSRPRRSASARSPSARSSSSNEATDSSWPSSWSADRAAPRWSAAGSVRRRKPAHQPRNSSIRPSRRPRNASRPRWIRDLTVPSETPVMSAISA